jgi:tRNA(fMet)-specific endonuclease VapC
MYLLDTNHCSRIIFGEPEIVQQLQLHSEAGVATSVIVRGELSDILVTGKCNLSNGWDG